MFPSVPALIRVVCSSPLAIAPGIVLTCLAAPCRATPPVQSGPVAVMSSLEPASRRSLPPSERGPGLSPHRIAAFRSAMAELSGRDITSPVLHFRADYVTPQPRLGSESRPRLFAEDDTIAMSPGMVGRDLWAEEEFLIQGREDDFYDASRNWMSRKIKGSDAAAQRRGGRFAPKFAWDDGPLAGFRRGPISVMAGEDQWSVRWSRKMARPGWVARVSCGIEDGEERVAFSIGRSLFHARTAR